MVSDIDESRRKCGRQVGDSSRLAAGNFSVHVRLAHTQVHRPALEITRI